MDSTLDGIEPIVRSSETLNDRIRDRAVSLSALWGVPELAGSITIKFSSRMTRSLGRADFAAERITIAESIALDPLLLDEVLCHELAHLAAFQLVGRREPPHGPTWMRLVLQAGHAPELRLVAPRSSSKAEASRTIPAYLHRCMVCQFTRIGRRPMAAWRCADCVRAGLSGKLEIQALRRAD